MLAQQLLHSDPFNIDLSKKEKEASISYVESQKALNSFLAQKSKIDWLQYVLILINSKMVEAKLRVCCHFSNSCLSCRSLSPLSISQLAFNPDGIVCMV
ncbi:hypothetical protein RIF29_20889 [Crotalaria pallida]|uniref:Uncharacterized protein n=1 Tax=Crotalaria pallida TaxID=3830 RepID=A0AAN9F6C7_CROPI